MKNLYKWGFIHSLGILVYIAIVATIMNNGEKWFGKIDNSFLGPLSFLLLFTLSALVVGGLTIGKPVMLYIDGKKKEALSLFFITAGWLVLFTLIALLIAAVR